MFVKPFQIILEYICVCVRERDVIDIGDKHTVENKKKFILVQDKMDKGSNKKHSKQQTYLVGKHLVMLLLC